MPTVTFEIDDAKTFDANLAAFIDTLASIDPHLAAAAKAELPKVLRGEIDKTQFWDALLAATGNGAAS